MAKVSEQTRKIYADRVRDYKQQIDQITQHEKTMLALAEKDEDEGAAAIKRLSVAEERLNLASIYLLMNRMSQTLMGIKNEAYLNDARKCCYDSIIHLEKVVTDFIDVPWSEYSDRLELIDQFTDDKRYGLMRKLGFTIDSMEEDFGENTKWQWTFPDLEARYAVVCKNLVNFKTIVANLDPRVDGYDMRFKMLRLVKENMAKAAERIHMKYVMSTQRIDDFKMAITLLAALRRMHMVLGEGDQAERIKKNHDVWKARLEEDAKKQEQKSGS